MNREDAERVARGNDLHRSHGITCAVCDRAPTCPMLKDEVWTKAWSMRLVSRNGEQVAERTVRCTCAGSRARKRPAPEPALVGHAATCEIYRGPREFLCLDCVERALGRRLTLDDLHSCVGNYPTVVMVLELQAELRLLKTAIAIDADQQVR